MKLPTLMQHELSSRTSLFFTSLHIHYFTNMVPLSCLNRRDQMVISPHQHLDHFLAHFRRPMNIIASRRL